MTAHERSGWRDERISLRHREWGLQCPGTDLDFTLVEYNYGNPVAVVDYKEHSKPDPFKGVHVNSLRAMASLYNERGDNLPFFICRYWPDDPKHGTAWAYEAYPMNKPARELLRNSEAWTPMTERQWVEGLLRIRRTAVSKWDQGRRITLCEVLPPEAEQHGSTNLPPQIPEDATIWGRAA